MALQNAPDFALTTRSLADVTVSGKVALGDLSAGPTGGILVTAHPSNGSVILRVSGDDVSTTKGQPLAAGASYTFARQNASSLSVIAETGSGTLCVTAV